MRNIVVNKIIPSLLVFHLLMALNASAEDKAFTSLRKPSKTLQPSTLPILQYQEIADISLSKETRELRLQNTLQQTLPRYTDFKSGYAKDLMDFGSVDVKDLPRLPPQKILLKEQPFGIALAQDDLANARILKRKSMEQTVNENIYAGMDFQSGGGSTSGGSYNGEDIRPYGSEVWRTIQECSDAQSNLSKFEVNFSASNKRKFKISQTWLVNPNYFDQVWYVQNKLLSNELSTYVSLIETYSANCLSSLKEGDVGARHIKAIVGVLSEDSNESQEIECTAFRIKNNRIVTAKHCLNALLKAIDNDALNFTLSANTQIERVKVIGETCALDKYRELSDCQNYINETKGGKVNADFAILEIESMKTQMPELDWTSSSIKNSDTVILAAWNSYPKMAEIGKKALQGETPDLNKPEELYISKKGFCQIANISKSCILHGCQSTEGGSGAPLLVLSEAGIPRIVGIHVSTAAKVSGDSDCKTSKVRVDNMGYLGNVGIPVASSINKIARF